MTAFIEYATYAVVILTVGVILGKRHSAREYERGRESGALMQRGLDQLKMNEADRRVARLEREYSDTLKELRKMKDKYPDPHGEKKADYVKGRVRHEYVPPTSYPNARPGGDDTIMPMVTGMALGAAASSISSSSSSSSDSYSSSSCGGGDSGGGGGGD